MRPSHSLIAVATVFVLLAADPAVARDEAAKKVDVSFDLLTEESIASFALEIEPVATWMKPVMGDIEAQFARETKRRTVVVQVNLHPDRPGEVVVAGRPALTQAEVETLLKLADPSKAPRTRVVDCSFRLVAKVNGGDPDESGPLIPPIQTPDEQRLARFRAASTTEKLALMEKWARTEAIPFVAAVASTVDPKFEGVRNLGKSLGKLKPAGPIDVEALTGKNPDFWRAMMEMARGIPLIPTTQVLLHTAKGEIDQAIRTLRWMSPFDKKHSGYSTLLVQFGQMATLFEDGVNARIREGIALNDKGEFDEALKVYGGVLKDYPKSAWAHYERFHTTGAKLLRDKAPDEKFYEAWPEARKAILDADPLYESMAAATGPEEAYDLLLRMEAKSLFKDRDRLGRDYVRYADIALDLGQPGFAAMIYWNVLSSIKPEDYGNRALLLDYLYSLEQLNIKGIKSNFKGDHAAEFKRIDAEREKRKRESTAFKSFVDPEEPASKKPENPD